jgi:hypothetical protein
MGVRLRSALLAALLPLVVACAPDSDPVDPLAAFTPTAADPDPSTRIEGIAIDPPVTSAHVRGTERVRYEQSPPFGGSHDAVWADCSGTVYDTAVRNENMVHSLEHGTVWIAYHPDRISGEALESLVNRVEGRPYTMLSPYPGLESPISLQSWGHQLMVEEADDPRIDQFIRALRANSNTHPEPGASCTAGPQYFDVDAPPPFGS